MENIEQELNEAICLIDNEEFAEAKSKLEKILEKDSTNLEVYKNLGLCEVNLDNPIDAIKAFRKAVEIDNQDATSLFYLASCYNKTGQKEFAIINYKKVIDLRPNYKDAYFSLGMIYIEHNQCAQAIELMEKYISNPENEIEYTAYYILATAYMLKEDNLNAIKNLETAHNLNPEHQQIANSLAVAYMNAGKMAKVKGVLDTAFKFDNENALTLYNYGVYYQTLGQADRALEYFKQAYEKEPSATMLSTLANCALVANDFNLAEILYKNLTAAYPNNPNYRLSYLQALEGNEKFEEALVNVDILLAADDKNIDFIKKKGVYLRKLCRYEESIEVFNRLIKAGKIDVEVYYNIAFDYVLSLDYDNAKEMFKKCIELEPNNPFAHKDLGVLYLKMNLYDWAIDEIKTAIELEEDVSEFHYSLGVCYMMLSKIEEAKTALENAIKYDPNNADALAYYGYIYLLDKQYPQALAILQKAIQIDPKNFLARSHVAKCYFAIEKFEIAKQFLLDLTKDTKDDETLNMLAICYMKTQCYEEACGLFSKLAFKYPDNHILLTDLARCEYNTGKKEEATEHIRKALFIFNDYAEALELLEEIKLNGK